MEIIMAHLISTVLPVTPRKIATILPDETVQRCIELMSELDIGALVIVDHDKNLKGLISERDILRSCIFKGLNPNGTKAIDIAFQNVTILSPHDVIETAMKAMTDTKRRHILIQDNGSMIAILSIGDILYHLIDDKLRVIEQLEKYISSY